MGVGGPYAWRASGGDQNSSPLNGDLSYHVEIDEWFNEFPVRTSTYGPTAPADIAHWDINGKGKIISYFDGALGYWQNKTFGFGCFTPGVGALRYRDLATGVITVLTTDVPLRNLPREFIQGGIDANGQCWQFANNFDYCTWNWGSAKNSPWVHHVITNPPVVPPLTGQTASDSGAKAALDQSQNRIVVWVGHNAPSGGWSGVQAVQKTWTIDRGTLTCTPVTTRGPVPPPTNGASQVLFYNAARKKVQLVVCNASNAAEVWEFT
jgi:hypothetical protein